MGKLEQMKDYQYCIALPAPSFYAQFPKCKEVGQIIEALHRIGFTECMDVAYAAEVIAKKTKVYVQSASSKPVISSACPVIVRLIQRCYPELIEHLLPIMSPMELAARTVKALYKEKGIEEDAVGVFFISPCPAKATDIQRPKGFQGSAVDVCLSMQEVYKAVMNELKHPMTTRAYIPSVAGMSWATHTGGATSIAVENHIAVDGIESVRDILEKIEDDTLQSIDFVEALGCTGGCLGGALTIENPFVSRHTLKKMMDDILKKANLPVPIPEAMYRIACGYEEPIMSKPVFSLDKDIEKALEMMDKIEKLHQKLPQIDCGSCGAPTCKSFAEDVVKGDSNIEECVFMLKKRIKELSEAMLELTRKFI